MPGPKMFSWLVELDKCIQALTACYGHGLPSETGPHTNTDVKNRRPPTDPENVITDLNVVMLTTGQGPAKLDPPLFATAYPTGEIAWGVGGDGTAHLYRVGYENRQGFESFAKWHKFNEGRPKTSAAKVEEGALVMRNVQWECSGHVRSETLAWEARACQWFVFRRNNRNLVTVNPHEAV